MSNNIKIPNSWLSVEDLRNKYDSKMMDILEALKRMLVKQHENKEKPPYVLSGKKTKDIMSELYINPDMKYLNILQKELNKKPTSKKALKKKSKKTKKVSPINGNTNHIIVPANYLSINDLKYKYGLSYPKVKQLLETLYESKSNWDADKEGFEFPIMKGRRNTFSKDSIYISDNKKAVKWFANKINKLTHKTLNAFWLTNEEISVKSGFCPHKISAFVKEIHDNKENWDKDFEFPVEQGVKEHKFPKKGLHFYAKGESYQWFKQQMLKRVNIYKTKHWRDVSRLRAYINYEEKKIFNTIKALYEDRDLSDDDFPILYKFNESTKKDEYFLRVNEKNIKMLNSQIKQRYGDEDFVPANWENARSLNRKLKEETKVIDQKLKEFHKNKHNWDAKKEGFEFPIKKGEKYNSNTPGIYYLNPNVKVVKWFKNQIESQNNEEFKILKRVALKTRDKASYVVIPQ